MLNDVMVYLKSAKENLDKKMYYSAGSDIDKAMDALAISETNALYDDYYGDCSDIFAQPKMSKETERALFGYVEDEVSHNIDTDGQLF